MELDHSDSRRGCRQRHVPVGFVQKARADLDAVHRHSAAHRSDSGDEAEVLACRMVITLTTDDSDPIESAPDPHRYSRDRDRCADSICDHRET